MCRRLPLLVVIGLAVSLSSRAPAQTSGSRSGRDLAEGQGSTTRLGGDPSNPLLIVMAPAVQSELKLTEAQKTKVYRLVKDIGQKSRELFQSMILAGGNPQAMLMARANLRREIVQQLGQVLDKHQQERLNQISMRVEGAMAVGRPEVAEKLNLTPDQLAAVQSVMMVWQRSQRQMLMAVRANTAATGELDPDAYAQLRLGSTRLRRHATEQIGQILNRKQRVNFEKLLGPPFDLGKLNGEEEADAPKPAAAPADTKDDAKGQGEDASKKKSDTPKRRKGRRERSSNSS